MASAAEGEEVSPQCVVAREGSFLPGARGLSGSIEPFPHSGFTEFHLFVCLAWGTGQRAEARWVVLLPQTGAGAFRKLFGGL